MTILILFIIIILAFVWIFWWPKLRLQRVITRPFPKQFEQILLNNIAIYSRMPYELQLQLQNLIKRFLSEKKFYGCNNLQIDDEIRLTIAAEACLLLLNRKTEVYPKLRSILVYPTAFIAPRIKKDGAGIISHQAQGLLGESWSDGRVILAWDHVQHGTKNFYDGQNVVLHEFAHQLDSEFGGTDGAPLLNGQSSYRSWAAVLSAEFEKLQECAEQHQRSVLDHYGATNPAEFFAVATETFFEKPEQMAKKHPELFDELKGFYQVDPMLWQ